MPQPARETMHQQRRELHRAEEIRGGDSPRDGTGFEVRRERHEQFYGAESDKAVEREGAKMQSGEHARERGDATMQVEHPCGAQAARCMAGSTRATGT